MKRPTARLVSTLLFMVATLFLSTASALLIHRPEVPAELLKK